MPPSEPVSNFLDNLFLANFQLVLEILTFGVFFLIFLFISGYFLVVWWRNRFREKKSLGYVLLQVAVPKDNEIKIDAAEQMFAAFSSLRKGGRFEFLKSQDFLSFEIVGLPEDVRFYISVPGKLRDMVEKQIHGAYPGAEIQEAKEYNIFSEKGKVAFSELQFRSAPFFPIKVYKDLPTDPLALITSALAKMQPGEGAAIQLLFTPANRKWASSGKRFLAKTKKTESDPEKATYKTDPKQLEAIENKCTKPGFEVSLKMVVSSPTMESAKAHLANLKAAFEQFNSDQNGFKSRKIRLNKLFMTDFIYRYPPQLYFFRNKIILSSEELAGIFHLPNKTVETPFIFWLNAKRAPAPQQIPKEGLYLGKSAFRGIEVPVYIQDKDRMRHIYIIGATGTGKSQLLAKMMYQDMKAGKGFCFIDPHDTFEMVMQLIPPERAEDVIYFSPADTERPMGLNLIEAQSEDQKHFIASAIINLMYKLYDPYKTGIIGPRFEHAIRNAMLTVMCEPGATFVEVMRALQDQNFVQELLPKVQDPMVRRYWTDQIAQTADFHKSEVLDYIVSKFGRFVTNRMMRNIVGQSKSSFDFRKVMDEGKILIINLAKGQIGEENSSFLGLVLVPKILMAAMSRSDIPEAQRKDFYLYVDEFQNFATPDFAQILSEARKFHLGLCVANQFIGQMDDEVKNAVFGNCGTKISFRVGVTDAQYLQHEYTPTFSESDLLNIEAYNAYVKTLVGNEPVPAFSMTMKQDMPPIWQQQNPKMSEMVKELSRLKYGRSKAVVEAEIAQRARL
ncbi:MAG: AAA-like domain protein [Microgenomates group bacterium ADurb.Bin219]|nr:MAG: AAA-like domain protein [Microgenomates group bacterium ADurb.Bin219]HNP89032.1 type IV secretion system DNA-binding domain-containing protein [Candidatus Woesebacteria bacterium]